MAMGPSLPAPKEEEGGGQAGPGLLPLSSQGQKTEPTDTQLNHPVSWAAAPQVPAPGPSQPWSLVPSTPAQAARDGGGLGSHLAPRPLPDPPGRKHMTTCPAPRGNSWARKHAQLPPSPASPSPLFSQERVSGRIQGERGNVGTDRWAREGERRAELRWVPPPAPRTSRTHSRQAAGLQDGPSVSRGGERRLPRSQPPAWRRCSLLSARLSAQV